MAKPDDLVLLAFSGHGYTDPSDGDFYIFPHDLGIHTGKFTPEFLQEHCISSEELSMWLREVDAGEIVMIVDTCHAAAAVEGKGDFKPGPMGSRGLGQLAYDKGMRLLAASQAGDVAIESQRIRQGLLTYALIRDGLEQRRAAVNGRITIGSWLAYAERRVPTLYQEVLGGKIRNASNGVVTSAQAIVSKTAREYTQDRPTPSVLARRSSKHQDYSSTLGMKTEPN